MNIHLYFDSVINFQLLRSSVTLNNKNNFFRGLCGSKKE